MENKGTIFSIIALIIGASGLGLGAFSVITIQTIDSEQGPPGEAPGYFCTSAAEIQQALDSIGNGFGTIIINESITLTSKISINGGGSYVIQGQGAGTTIDCGGNWNAFEITEATSCIIKDLKIDASDIGITTEIININEINNNPVYIERVQIMGDQDRYGYGINLGSENIWISDCYINKVYDGIYQSTGGEAHISDNIILDCGAYGMEFHGDYNHIIGNSLDTGVYAAIRIFSSFSMVLNNFIRNFEYGINIYGENNTIKDNYLQSLEFHGIYLTNDISTCDNNIISGNYISEVGSTGIWLDRSNFTIISDNYIYRFGVNGYGIHLDNCHSNLVSENGIYDGGLLGISIVNGDYNMITGNLIRNISRTLDSSSICGIYLFSDADFNTITGNGIFNCNSYGGGTGYGIYILGSNCDDNTVVGNTSLDNDDNWQDTGTNTFGDETYNNFA